MIRTRRLRSRAVMLLAATLFVAGCSSGSDAAGDDDAPDEVADTTTTTLGGVLTGAMDLLAGQCFNRVPDPVQQPFAVFVTPCDEHHEFEAYSKTQIELGSPQPEGAPYPGALVVANAAEAQCITGFASFVGQTWEMSEFDVQTWWPSEQSWTQANDRLILCAVYPVVGGTTEGSARSSAR